MAKLYIYGLMLGTILSSCWSHKVQEVADSAHEESIPTEDSFEFVEVETSTNSNENPTVKKALVKSDTVQLKNGLHAIRIFELGPMNECIVFKDKRGRTITIYSHASETDGQILAFSYGTNGRLILVREFHTDILELTTNPETLLKFIRDNNAVLEYRFVYNEEGRLSEISRKDNRPESKGSEIIKASDGNHLEGDFRPVEDFWESDLRGGQLEIHCHEVTNYDSQRTDTIRKWINFEPTSNFDNPPIIPEEFLREPMAIPFGKRN